MTTKETTPEVPSKEFLEELVTWAKKYGWSGDYVEIRYFIETLYSDAGLECPDLELDD